MSKQVTILLSDKAVEVVDTYAQEHSCTRNKAVNELIIGQEGSSINLKLNKLLKISSAIYKKVNGWLLI